MMQKTHLTRLLDPTTTLIRDWWCADARAKTTHPVLIAVCRLQTQAADRRLSQGVKSF